MSSTSTIFCPMPKIIYVDEDPSVRPLPYGKISMLVESFRLHGPLVAVGKFGPEAHEEEPYLLKERINYYDIFSWPHNSVHELSPVRNVILLGAREASKTACVYYIMADDISQSPNSTIKGYTPSQTDARIYMVSFQDFLQRSLFDLHPVCSYGHLLYATPAIELNSKGGNNERCRAIGQKIFEQNALGPHRDWSDGYRALMRVYEATKCLCADGEERQSIIDDFWDGVGDLNWSWKAKVTAFQSPV